MPDHERLERGAGDDRAMKPLRRDDVGDGWIAKQHGDLAEEISAAESAVVLAVDADDRFAREDDVEARSTEALPQDALAIGKAALVDDVGDRLELGRAEIGEQRQGGELVAELAARRCHSHMSRPDAVGWQLGERERTIA